MTAALATTTAQSHSTVASTPRRLHGARRLLFSGLAAIIMASGYLGTTPGPAEAASYYQQVGGGVSYKLGTNVFETGNAACSTTTKALWFMLPSVNAKATQAVTVYAIRDEWTGTAWKSVQASTWRSSGTFTPTLTWQAFNWTQPSGTKYVRVWFAIYVQTGTRVDADLRLVPSHYSGDPWFGTIAEGRGFPNYCQAIG